MGLRLRMSQNRNMGHPAVVVLWQDFGGVGLVPARVQIAARMGNVLFQFLRPSVARASAEVWG